MDSKTYKLALKIVREGDWDKAHRIVQEIDTPEARHVARCSAPCTPHGKPFGR